MRFALFIAEKDSSDKLSEDFQYFLGTAKDKLGKLEGVAKLNEGTFLCNLSFGLHPLSILVAASKQWNIRSRTLFFDSDPSWIIS